VCRLLCSTCCPFLLVPSPHHTIKHSQLTTHNHLQPTTHNPPIPMTTHHSQPSPQQAAELMAEWAPIEVADALELLSPDFKNDEVLRCALCAALRFVCCAVRAVLCWERAAVGLISGQFALLARRLCPPTTHTLTSFTWQIKSTQPRTQHDCYPQVRSHAVQVLQQKDDEELLYYLLQLVQVRVLCALCVWSVCALANGSGSVLSVAGCQAASSPPPTHRISTALNAPPHRTSPNTLHTNHPLATVPKTPKALRFEAVDLSRLARFLIVRATANPAFATYLHWWVGGPRASGTDSAAQPTVQSGGPHLTRQPEAQRAVHQLSICTTPT